MYIKCAYVWTHVVVVTNDDVSDIGISISTRWLLQKHPKQCSRVLAINLVSTFLGCQIVPTIILYFTVVLSCQAFEQE